MAFRGHFSFASQMKQGVVRPMITKTHGSTILARGKHGRLCGGCSPRELYHTHLLKIKIFFENGGAVAEKRGNWENMYLRIDFLCSNNLSNNAARGLFTIILFVCVVKNNFTKVLTKEKKQDIIYV